MTELEKLKRYLDSHGVVNETHNVFLKDDPEKYQQIIVYDEYNGNLDPETEDPILKESWMFVKVFDKWFIRSWDVVCHPYSYGGEKGLLEIYGDIEGLDASVDGWLTADDVIYKYMMKDPRYQWEEKDD